MFGYDHPISPRSTTAVRRQAVAIVQARYLPASSLPMTRMSNCRTYFEHLSATHFRIATFKISHVISFLTKSKTVSYVGKRIVVILAASGLIQELACKKMSKTQAIADMADSSILSHQGEF